MNILAVDTTGLAASCAIVDGNKTVAEFTTNLKKTHSQTIMPMIDSLMSLTGLTANDMDYFACSIGPGSFTGIRIGVATVMGLAFGANKKIVPVSALDALAYNVYMTGCIIAPIMDARRDQVYGCLYRYGGDKLIRLCDYFAMGVGECMEKAASYGEKVLFTGDGALVFADRIKSEDGFFTAEQHVNMQRAAAVGALAYASVSENAGVAVQPGDVRPFYLRPPQAERERESLEKGSERLD